MANCPFELDLLAEGFLSPASLSLYVDAPAGYEVLALREVGVPDAVGVAKKKAPPLVVTGDLLRQPFAAGEFDFVFAGLSLDRSKRPADLKAEIARTTKPEGLIVVHTASAADLYLAEVSPPRWRGAFTTGFQFFLLARVVVASITNYFTARLCWGWRLSVGLGAVLLLGPLFIPDTPSSLIHRGMPDAARSALRRLRGPAADVDAELKDVARAVEDARLNEQGAFARILLQRRYGPYLVMSFAIPLFQQFTGVIVLAFFSPILFQTVGFGSNTALMGAIILVAVDLVAILVSTFTIDRYGRKVLLIVGGVQMIVSLITVSWIMGSKMGGNGQATMAKPYATAVVVLLCLFSSKRHQFLLSKLSVFNPP